MTETTSKMNLPPAFPDHTQLPESDGTFVKNFQEHPQSILLTDSKRIIRIPYYGIYEMKQDKLEVYHLINSVYQKMSPNQRDHYPIEPLGVELGLWYGSYQNQTQLWLRWWDHQGNLLLTGNERAEQAEQTINQAISRLLAMGLTVQKVAEALNITLEKVQQNY